MRNTFLLILLIPTLLLGQKSDNHSILSYSDSITIMENCSTTNTQIYRTLRIIRNLRTELNWTSEIDSVTNIDKIDYYKKAYSDILNIKGLDSLEIEEIDTNFHNIKEISNYYYSDSVKKFYIDSYDLNTSPFLCDFIFTLLIVDSCEHYYEQRLFRIPFNEIPEEKIHDPYLKDLVTKYNWRVRSVSRRMGRIIQAAHIEDPDYVTYNVFTRLDLALSDLRTAELDLRAAIDRRGLALRVIRSHNNDDQNGWYAFASTDLENIVGVGVLHNLDRFNWGIDGYAVFQTEGGFQIHPKIGLPVHKFHFLAGMLWEVSSVSELNYEYTGNVYYADKGFIGGIGFSKNRILFSVGWGFK